MENRLTKEGMMTMSPSPTKRIIWIFNFLSIFVFFFLNSDINIVILTARIVNKVASFTFEL